ncbi:MAG: hypothetical protein BWY76_02865 [bacterium ADurb.Bin429]|nr:MAG: hypothetical protein BWY76_02865 [bacterium ADurb.Bin429]
MSGEGIDGRDWHVRKQRFAVAGDALPAEIGAQHLKRFQVVDLDEVGGVAGPQQADIQAVVPHGIDAGTAQHAHDVNALAAGGAHLAVNMPPQQVVRVQVIAAEHAGGGGFGDERQQFRAVPRGGAFANQYTHPQRDAFARFFQRRHLMVGGDTGVNVGAQGLAAYPRRMPVNGLTVAARGSQEGHHARVALDDRRIVHHLAQTADVG